MTSLHFNSPWELDGVRTLSGSCPGQISSWDFNSPWELDGVRTFITTGSDGGCLVYTFQFPLGIRWCSDGILRINEIVVREGFQFPLGIRWCSDGMAWNEEEYFLEISIPPGN